MSNTQVRPAVPAEAAELSELALRSKAHWGYSADFLDSVRAELTIQAELCDGVRLIAAERDGTLLEFHQLAGDPPEGARVAVHRCSGDRHRCRPLAVRRCRRPRPAARSDQAC